ncbi:hypothetical protein [Alicyclobacillus fructus]|uniref:hypothetical protein n=1 Tax=Alicyclobacillus fructus TaxID=2816082 RepID=UPI001A8CD1BB|nr:hypothetical protein [Alicyclobacillus fructus]
MSHGLWAVAAASFIVSIALWAWRLRVPKGTRGRGWLTAFTWLGWLAFLSLAGYGAGFAAGDRGVNLLHVLHISR